MPRLLIEPRPYSLIRVQNSWTPFSSPRCISPLSLFLSITCCSSHPPPPREALQPRCAATALLRPPSPQAVTGGNFSPATSPQLLRLRGRASSAMNGGTSSTSSSAPALFAATATGSSWSAASSPRSPSTRPAPPSLSSDSTSTSSSGHLFGTSTTHPTPISSIEWWRSFWMASETPRRRLSMVGNTRRHLYTTQWRWHCMCPCPLRRWRNRLWTHRYRRGWERSSGCCFLQKQ